MKDVYIHRQPVELYKLLKFEGIASTGGEAKLLIADGFVSVNGRIEIRKRRKMMAGDIFEIGDDQYRLVLSHR